MLIGEEAKKGEGDKWKKKDEKERGRRKRKGPWCFKKGFVFGFIFKLFWSCPGATKSQWSGQALPKAVALLHLTALHRMQSLTEMKSTKVLYKLWNQNGRTLYSLCLYAAEKDYTQHREMRHKSPIASTQEIEPCWGIWCCHWQKVSAPSETGGS